MEPSSDGFEILEHTADVGIRGWGRDPAGLFGAMARGLFSVITDPDAVRPRTERRFTLRGDTVEDLLHDWLEALNAEHQIHHELYSEFTVEITGGVLTGAARGEAIDLHRHDLRTEVKAVTWHDLQVTETPHGIEARVLLDI